MGRKAAMSAGYAARSSAGVGLPIILVAAVAFTLASCSILPRSAFSEREQKTAHIPGMPNVRFFADMRRGKVMPALGVRAVLTAGHRAGSLDILTISGGASDGAFGAGVVTGWTKTRRRPKFTIVVGVSAGALIAPFAFLGPKYDGRLREAFTNSVDETIGDGGGRLTSVIIGPTLRRRALYALISRYVDTNLLRAIAAEHRRGRRLLVVTTNLDAQRAVVWNMGAIASSRSPRALGLFRDILTASCSVPGLFAPTRIMVTANGRQLEELHADGGLTAYVFTALNGMSGSADGDGGKHLRERIFVILNTRLDPEFQVVEAEFAATLKRSFLTLSKAHTKAALLASLGMARSTGTDFNVAYIRNDLPKNLKPSFSTSYMRTVYNYGHARAAARRIWTKTIPLQWGY